MQLSAADNESLNLDGGGARATGDYFPRLRRLFTQLGGDMSRCPFGPDYAGPVIRWSDEGWPYMHSSNQKELFNEGSL